VPRSPCHADLANVFGHREYFRSWAAASERVSLFALFESRARAVCGNAALILIYESYEI